MKLNFNNVKNRLFLKAGLRDSGYSRRRVRFHLKTEFYSDVCFTDLIAKFDNEHDKQLWLSIGIVLNE